MGTIGKEALNPTSLLVLAHNGHRVFFFQGVRFMAISGFRACDLGLVLRAWVSEPCPINSPEGSKGPNN